MQMGSERNLHWKIFFSLFLCINYFDTNEDLTNCYFGSQVNVPLFKTVLCWKTRQKYQILKSFYVFTFAGKPPRTPL